MTNSERFSLSKALNWLLEINEKLISENLEESLRNRSGIAQESLDNGFKSSR